MKMQTVFIRSINNVEMLNNSHFAKKFKHLNTLIYVSSYILNFHLLKRSEILFLKNIHNNLLHLFFIFIILMIYHIILLNLVKYCSTFNDHHISN